MNFFEDDPSLRHVIEFYLGPGSSDLVCDALSEFGGVAAGGLRMCIASRDPGAARVIHQSGLMALHSEPGNAAEHIMLCHMIARTGDERHLRDIALESGLAKLLSVVDVEELRFEFMAGLLDRRVEARPRVGKTVFGFDYPVVAGEPIPTFISGESSEKAGSLSGGPCEVNRIDANLIVALAMTETGEWALCLAQTEARAADGRAVADFESARAWRIGSKHHPMEFMLDALRANDQLYALVHASGMLRVASEENDGGAARAWSAALLAGAVYLAYLEDMVELGHARPPEAVFRRIMLECADCALSGALTETFSREATGLRAMLRLREVSGEDRSTRGGRIAREMNEKNLWPLCLERLRKFLGELDETALAEVRGELQRRLEILEAEMAEAKEQGPAFTGALFMIFALASEANWAIKNKGDETKQVWVKIALDSLARVFAASSNIVI